MPTEIRADLAPGMAIMQARKLLEPVLPKHKNVVEAERILAGAQRQADLLAHHRQHNTIDPFGRARIMLEEGYGLGRDQVVEAIRTDPVASAIHSAAIVVIARLIAEGTR